MNGTDAIDGRPSPRECVRLMGHEPAERTLLRTFRSGRMPHGWLITGPRGIGKATLAYRFARFVLAQRGRDFDLFGTQPDSLYVAPDDPIFHQLASGGHPDFLSLERTTDEKGRLRSVITVGEARRVAAFLRMTPAEGGWRVVIVDPVDDMNVNAASAILKILEEPPTSALLILVSHSPNRLLPTIRSRCCRLTLAPLPAETVGALLDHHRPDMSAADRAVVIRLAQGSIGQALDFADRGGLVLYRDVVKLLRSLPDLDVPSLHTLGDRALRAKDWSTFHTTAEFLSQWLARMIRYGADGRPPAELVPGERELMARLLKLRALADWLELWENLTRLFAEAEPLYLDRKQVLLAAFLQVEAFAKHWRLLGEYGWCTPDGTRLP